MIGSIILTLPRTEGIKRNTFEPVSTTPTNPSMASQYNHTAALEKNAVNTFGPGTGRRLSIDEETKNYPSEGDSTASGGYGSTQNVWSDAAQRGNNDNNKDTYEVSSGAWTSYPSTPRAETPVIAEQIIPERFHSVLSKEVRDAQDGKATDRSRIVGA
ncbi:hypothetical protein E1B28_013123 [Marasmius oreades]|uniref:Uncharacterized protein n=1 Tax=Marasmius oreades TaxID=181124 RepID=A0A9P7RPU3_9AGAR|nr:uncharacterized protein E1B28_013123 [Marasmius oreades]KAG7087143.1 hypothetical protein E1B28_013123 [Marasmius oreades]